MVYFDVDDFSIEYTSWHKGKNCYQLSAGIYLDNFIFKSNEIER